MGEFTWLAVSDVVAVGGLTAIVGIAGVVGTILVAHTQARSAMQTAAQVRFASWQITKREVFAEFLEAARAMRDQVDAPSAEVSANYTKQGYRTLLYAYEDAREKVDQVLEQPNDLKDERTWAKLLEQLREDVLTEGRAN